MWFLQSKFGFSKNRTCTTAGLLGGSRVAEWSACWTRTNHPQLESYSDHLLDFSLVIFSSDAWPPL